MQGPDSEEEILLYLIKFLVKEGRKQSMSEDFQEGYQHAIYQIGQFGKFDPYPMIRELGNRDVMHLHTKK